MVRIKKKNTSPKDAVSVTTKDTDLNVTTFNDSDCDTDGDKESDTDSGDSDTGGDTNGANDDAVNSTVIFIDNPDGSLSVIGNGTSGTSFCLDICTRLGQPNYQSVSVTLIGCISVTMRVIESCDIEISVF